MKLTSLIRKKIFFGIDHLKGKPIKSHLIDLQRADMINIAKRLDYILNHTKNTVKFYNNINLNKGLQAFPIINKSIIKENQLEFFSSKFKKSELVKTITSGSTGTPFESYQNINKKNRNTADTIFFANLAGYEMGSKLYYLKIWSENNKKSSILQKLQNIVPIDVLNLNKNVSTVIANLNNEQSKINFLGYVSAFETICGFLERNESVKLKLNVSSIITMSEGLNQTSRDMIQKHFNCPVYSRYSNVENGILAQQTSFSGNDFLINTASYKIEIINLENDNPAPIGKIGRIVVTDLYNEGMPFIRYDTGDVGIIERKKINGNYLDFLTYIGGRKLDQIFNTQGELISSYVVYKNMWDYPEIEQYQLIQLDDKEYEFKICIAGTFDKETKLINEFKAYLGEDANFKIKYVEEIPLLDSGKRKKVVNLMNEKKTK